MGNWKTMNALRVLFPRREYGVWLFDDPGVGLVREPFVSGMPEILEQLVKDIPDAEHGFTLFLSDQPFPRYQAELVHLREEFGGNWYKLSGTEMEGWLCPALYLYFSSAPRSIYLCCAPCAIS
jgi:hypothetical protein